MDIFIAILITIGGLGVFLFGMKLLGDYLQNAAGDKLKILMGKVGNNRFSTIGIGAVVTAVIQSSSATTVMVVGFVNAGVMTLFQATGIIMGANIGTTITAQIVALSFLPVTEFFIALTGVGFFMTMIKHTKVKNAGMIMTGFGMIFAGLFLMSTAMKGLSDSPEVKQLFINADNPFLLFFIGLALTAVIQSSSATTGILITMAGQGLITLQSALFATLGINIGTCITALLAGIGANANAKRASVIHLLFNCIGSFIFFFIVYFAPVSNWLEIIFSNAIQTQIAMFHTFFNVTTTLILLPFITPLTKLATLIVREKKVKHVSVLKYVDERLLAYPSIALGQVRREMMYMMDIAYDNLQISLDAVCNVDLSQQEQFDNNDKLVMQLNRELVNYLIELSGAEIDLEMETEIATYHKAISDINRVADLAQNIMEDTAALSNNNARISDAGILELNQMRKALEDLKNAVREEFDRKDISDCHHIEQLEQAVDDMYLYMEDAHLSRIKSGVCNAFTATIFIPLINNLERIGDHIFNIFWGMKHYVKDPVKVKADLDKKHSQTPDAADQIK